MKTWIKGSLIGAGILLAAGATLYVLRKKGIIKWGLIPLDYDKELAKLFATKINAITQDQRNAKMASSELTPAERTKALVLMMSYGKDKTKLSNAEKEELYRYLNRVFGGTVNATGSGEAAMKRCIESGGVWNGSFCSFPAKRKSGTSANAEGDTGKGARTWHIPVYYPKK